jgi:Fur family transcriptional regulator, ferric uptake regulator
MIVGDKRLPYRRMVTPLAPKHPISFCRNTLQRREIRNVFEQSDRPLGADEVLELGREKMAGLGMATVYRTIKALTDEGWLVPVALPGASPRYEIRGKAHHHHFHCRKCHRIFELNGCVGQLRKMIPRTFEMLDHIVLIDGVCADCHRARKPGRPAAQRNLSMRSGNSKRR